MSRIVSIVPAILTGDSQTYMSQVEKVNSFTKRVQIDVTDDTFAPQKTLDIKSIWWPKDWTVDLHLMTSTPSVYLDAILELKPSLCIIHAEASEDLSPVFQTIKDAGIKTGLALLPTTFPGYVKQYIETVDHVLIFAGQLGVQGGRADLMQTEKIPIVRSIKPELEIGWDGGVNLSNVRALAHADLDVINVGSAISQADNPAEIYQRLVSETDENGVVL